MEVIKMGKLVGIVIVGVILMGVWFGYSKITEYQTYNKVCDSNTVETCKAFLDRFPESKYISEIQSWLSTLRINSLEGYENFAKTFPNSRLTKIALERAGIFAWEIAQKENTLSAYEQFVTEYPTHTKAEEANRHLSLLRIQEARRAFAELTDVDGAIWDSEAGWPIIFAEITKKDSSLPPIDMDDLIMAMKIVNGGEDPGVSIEPPGMSSPILPFMTSVPEHQNVRYIPAQIEGTHLGLRLFEVDRMLKALGFGEDPITGQSVRCSVPEFKTLPQLARKSEDLTTGYFGRIWFKPKEVVLVEDGNTIVFDKIVMGVESESPYHAPTEFARHFEKNYRQFANEKPIYKELIRIAKFVAIARWLDDRGYLYNLALSDYQMKSINTPSQTSTIQGLVKETYSGMWIQQYVLIGGVILDTRNSYKGGANTYIKNMSLGNFAKEVVKSRPYKAAIDWNFQIGNSKYKAVAIPLVAGSR